MTKGSILRVSLLFALPICAGNILQLLYMTVDTMVIGNFCSAASLAAVGTSGQPVEIFLCLFMGIGNGVSILASQYTGNGDMQSLRRLIGTASTFLYLCAIPLTAAGVALCPSLLRLMQVPADAFKAAVDYLRIIFLGLTANMGYNLNAGILRGLGDSRSTLLFLSASCVLNIALDLLLVAGLTWDVSGAALATTLAAACSWVLSILYLKKKYPELHYSPLPQKIDREMLGSVVRVGLPLGFNQSIYTVGHVFTQSLINAQGSVFIAACSVANRITGLANVATQSFASSATTFAGQNLGCGDYRRLKKGGLFLPFFTGAFTFCAAMLMLLFSHPLLGLFTQDMQVLAFAGLYLRVVLPFTWAFAVLNGIGCFINGMGRVAYPMAVNILMLWVVRIPAAYLISRYNGTYIMACFPISFLFGLLCMLIYYRTREWKELCQKAAHQENEAAGV